MNTHHRTVRSLKVPRRVRLRKAAALALATTAAILVVGRAQAGTPTEEPVSSGAYVPFVTDFPKPGASTTPAKPYVPFVTDFPQAAAQPMADGGTDWGEIGIGAGVGAAIAAFLAGSGLVLMRRARPAHS